jgi:hypothetical protein
VAAIANRYGARIRRQVDTICPDKRERRRR